MSANEHQFKPPLWAEDGFRENEWRRTDESEALEIGEKLILPLEIFLALDPATREKAGGRIGVEVLPGETIDRLVPYLDRLPLIALAFPAYNDGRSYSKAQLLRSRYGYRGELRATGDVLFDQVAHMLRCGFSTLEVTHELTRARLEAGDNGGIPLYYQPATRPAARGRFSWRRLSDSALS
ncbi:DUF934 domain-containing protein [Chelativorans sp. YIM 93263]|uniref:DUF934 domain-containing protein n=1 Tax=Chelativorans sp. YIM 93263 TaxID=2906648 RepID=UPI0023796527|nr:DUF934 domain-containing protein [Chelativorans sp. YIM 93263]